METYKLILQRRTIRKFVPSRIKKADLLSFINAARLAPSSANIQPLEYILITKNIERFVECTNWAGYVKDGGPRQEEKPTVFILVISNTKKNIAAKYDVGLAIENMLLAALEKGVVGCIIGSLNREKIIKYLNIPNNYVVELAVALGYPKQESVETKLKKDTRYWVDEKGVLHVPKRDLKDIIHKEIF